MLAWQAGCANQAGQVGANDPLLGCAASPGPQAAAAPRPGAPVPPVPAPSSTTSTAALAGGAYQPLDPNRDLRIGSPNPAPKAGGWRGPEGQPGVALAGPQPTAEPSPRVEAVRAPELKPAPTPVVKLTGGVASASVEALWALLEAKGVTWQRLETWGDQGQWKYSCSVPNRQNPNIRRNYEAVARTPRDAMRAVLEQMDQEQR